MAAASLPDILDRCLDDIRDGRATLDECLARYPEFRADLEPLLQVAASIAPLPSLPDPAHKLAARVRFVEALHAEPDKASLGERVRRLFRPSPSFRLGRPGLASVAIVAALFSTTGVLYASEQALPGAPLYGIKLAVEQVRLSAALNDEITAQVKMEIAERRLAEVERAAATNDTTALQLAAEYYARAVDDASATLDRIPPSDLAVIDRIQDNLQHQQDVLSRVADSAPAITKDSLDRAQQQARTGLERAAAVGGGARGSSAAPGRATPTPTVRPTSPPPTATTRITGQIGATSAATAVVILPTALPTAIPSGDASEVATPPPRPSATSARPATPDPTATARRPTPRPAREDDEDDTEQATPIPLITAPAGTALPIMTRVPVETGRRDSENEADHRDHDDGDEGENHRNPTAA
ncbi:MAG: hypothetical protein HY534_07865, partial [Chloroflexi bacterium]|nr:hypothetical protein [Chloroflexota bacterium]